MFSRLFGQKRRVRRRLNCGVVATTDALEQRLLLASTPLDPVSVDLTTEHKPQSKVWMQHGNWWAALADSDGTYAFRLDGTSWERELKLTSTRGHADVKVDGEIVHVLVEKGGSSKLVSLEYNTQQQQYDFWSQRPVEASVPVSGAETATIDVDSTGRMWVAYDDSSHVRVRYADSPYGTWSSEITLDSDIKGDDIAVVTALPSGEIAVMWSDQKAERFGFRVHTDGTDPGAANWSADEVPASQSALNVGDGMADDHINLAVASDGTLYAAVKTGFDEPGYTKMALLVRRPDGTWDDMYEVDTTGTRPMVQVNEQTDTVHVFYRETTSDGPIVGRQSSRQTIAFGESTTYIDDDKANHVTSCKDNPTGDLVVLASVSGDAEGARLVFDDVPPLQRTFQDGVNGYDGTRDTRLKSTRPTRNFHKSPVLQADGRPDFTSLLAWDTSDIPTDATVVSASITLRVYDATSADFPLYEMLTDWNHKKATFDRPDFGESWDDPGATGNDDRGSEPVAVIQAPGQATVTIALNSAGLQMVQRWIESPADNHGVIVQNFDDTATNRLSFRSSQATTIGNRPALTIDYRLPTGSGSGGSASLVADSGADSDTTGYFAALSRSDDDLLFDS